MRVSRFTVHRPVFTTMVTLIVILLGMVSLSRLPIDLMPDITFPTLTVRATYSNASPEEMETLVARPIEEAMVAIPGVEEISTACFEGTANVRIAFAWGTDLNEAANDIRERLDRVIPRLPDDADRPTLRKFDLAAFPILILGASSHLDPIQTRQIIEDQVKHRIERVQGVASLDIRGGLEREIHVNVQPERIQALGLSLPGVLRAIRDSNVTVPAGFVEEGHYEVTVRTPGEFTSHDELRDTAVAARGGTVVRLGDVARVEDAWQRVRRTTRIDGVPGIRLAVNKQSGTNTVEVARGVLAEIERINLDLPHLRITTIRDTSEYIQRSISNVSQTALYGGGLAVLVLLFFLRNLRSTAVVAIVIPISIIATFALIYFGGMTLNIMSLGGLALGVGMLVDNSIVVLENIFRLREGGMDSMEAATAGSEEVTSAILASTLTTVAVFLPLVFMRGMGGVMFKELAYVVAFALLCSCGAAITIVPMLSARMLRPGAGAGAGVAGRETLGLKLYRVTGGFFRFLENEYKELLRVALRWRWAVVLATLLALGGSLALVPLVGSELMPATDEGDVRVSLEMDVGTRLALFDERMAEIERRVREAVPEIRTMIATTGGSPWRGGGGHTGQLQLSLVPMAQRTRSSEQVAHALRGVLADIPGVQIRTRAGQGLFIFRRMAGGDERVEVEIRGHDLETADRLAQLVEAMAGEVEGVTDVRVSRDAGAPERMVIVDRDKAADMGLTVSEIGSMLQTVLAGSRAGEFREGGKEYRILVKVHEAERMGLGDLLDLTITNGAGEAVSLRNVTRLERRRGPTTIDRRNQERVTTVSANIHGRSLGHIIADLREGLQRIPTPPGFSMEFTGDYEEQQEAFAELLLSLVLALALVYMVMACQFESLRDPFVVMFSVPLAVIGVVLMLFFTGTTLNIQSYIGCIMLGGIVVNNAILLVDTTNLLRRRDGMGLREAIEEAGRRRLRPILMTALTTIFGLTPLALGWGEGAEAQAPMARAVIGGLLSASFITLVFVPVIYSLFERNGESVRNGNGLDG